MFSIFTILEATAGTRYPPTAEVQSRARLNPSGWNHGMLSSLAVFGPEAQPLIQRTVQVNAATRSFHFGPKGQPFIQRRGSSPGECRHPILSFRPEGPAIHPAKGEARECRHPILSFRPKGQPFIQRRGQPCECRHPILSFRPEGPAIHPRRGEALVNAATRSFHFGPKAQPFIQRRVKPW